ncbi:hypothetical protein ACFQV4_30885 [Streptomyces thermocarboxydus]
MTLAKGVAETGEPMTLAPGNYGWPYCTGRNDAHADHDFASGSSGARFDCSAPRNTSPRNTGLTELPPAQPAWIPYDGGSVPEFGTGSNPPWAARLPLRRGLGLLCEVPRGVRRRLLRRGVRPPLDQTHRDRRRRDRAVRQRLPGTAPR